jgi:hypothetical protein
MPSNWENIIKTVKFDLSDAAATTKKFFKIGKAELDIININSPLYEPFRELGIGVYDHINEEI